MCGIIEPLPWLDPNQAVDPAQGAGGGRVAPAHNFATVQDAVTLLNEALAADRMAVEILIGFRINCSQRLAFHPTIQVTQDYRVGMLGILNGIFGLYENTDLVCAVFEDGRLVRFVLTKPRVGEVITAAV